jgi:hypothetical protein
MRKLILAAVVGAALALAGGAGAGGWATVGVTPLPSGDETIWTPTLTILQHGRTPLDGVKPAITIRNDGTGATHTFAATPTGTSGVYSARVEFPGPGVWAYTIDDGFSQTHTYKPVEIVAPGSARAATPAPKAPASMPAANAPASTPTQSASLSLPWTIAGTAVILAALGLVVLLGRRTRSAATTVTAAN